MIARPAFAAIFFLSASAIARDNAFMPPPTGDAKGNHLTGTFVAVTPKIDFGQIALNEPTSRPVTFRNDTAATITVNRLDVVDAPHTTTVLETDECSGNQVRPGQACSVVATVLAEQRGPVQISIVAKHNGFGAPAEVTMTGQALDKPSLYAKPADLPRDLAAPPALAFAGASTRAIKLSNQWDKPIKISRLLIAGGQEAGMSVAFNECDHDPLPQGATCTVGLRWTNPNSAPATADLVISHTGPSQAVVIELNGLPPKEKPSGGSSPVNLPAPTTSATDRFLPTISNIRDAAASAAAPAAPTSLPRLIGYTSRTALVTDGHQTRSVVSGDEVALGGGRWRAEIADGKVWLVRGQERHQLILAQP